MSRQRVARVYFVHIHRSVQGFGGEEVVAAKEDDRSFVKVDVPIVLQLEEVNTGVSVLAASLAVSLRACFATYARALVSTLENLATSLIAWEACAGCGAGHRAVTLVLAGPGTSLDARMARLLTRERAA